MISVCDTFYRSLACRNLEGYFLHEHTWGLLDTGLYDRINKSGEYTLGVGSQRHCEAGIGTALLVRFRARVESCDTIIRQNGSGGCDAAAMGAGRGGRSPVRSGDVF